MIDVLRTGLIYRNPKPHLRAVHALHPTLAVLSDTEFLAAFDLGQGPESLDYATYLSRSTDAGQTWSAPRPLTPPITAGRYANQIVRISRLRDGSLAGFGARIYRDDPEEGFVSRETFGYAPLDLFLIRSADAGHTWTEPRLIQPPLVGPSFELCHPIVELRDGRWLAPTSTWKAWDGSAPNGMKAIALVSHDQGATWPEFLDVMDAYAAGVIHFEQSLAQLPDGRLLAVCWALHERSGTSGPVPYAVSDDGRTFGPRGSTGLSGQTTKLACLPNGHVLSLRRREDQPGLWAALSRLDGSHWLTLADVPVWQGRTTHAGSAPRAEELANLKCGSPNAQVLVDGTVIAAFWCHEDGLSVIRWVRMAVDTKP